MQSVFLDLQDKAQNLGSLTRKLYLDIKNGLNLENPITNKSDRPLCANGDHLSFYQIYSLQLETLGAFRIAICKSTSWSH